MWGKNWQHCKESRRTPIIVETVIPLAEKERPSRQKTGKDTVELNSFINQVNIIDIYRLFHSTIADYTFFPDSHTTFTR